MKYSLWQSGVRWLWLAPLVIVVDQLTKLAILQNLPYGGPGINVLPVFNIVHVYNKGAAFSFLADQAGWQRWFFALFAIVVSLVMLVALRRQAASLWWSNCAFVLVIGGAIGNLIDRIDMAMWWTFCSSTGRPTLFRPSTSLTVPSRSAPS